MLPCFSREGLGRLNKAGIPKDAVTDKFKTKYYEVVEDILDESKIGGFNTIVMGRRGLGMARELVLGSFPNKVVQKAKGSTIIVVE